MSKNKTQAEIISGNEVKARIIREHGTIRPWCRKHNLRNPILTRLFYRRPKYAFNGTETYRAIRALEADFGVTPSDLGIQVLEVER